MGLTRVNHLAGKPEGSLVNDIGIRLKVAATMDLRGWLALCGAKEQV